MTNDINNVMKPMSFRIFDEGVDVEELYNAEYWWIDLNGTVWLRKADTQTIHRVLGDEVEIKFMMEENKND